MLRVLELRMTVDGHIVSVALDGLLGTMLKFSRWLAVQLNADIHEGHQIWYLVRHNTVHPDRDSFAFTVNDERTMYARSEAHTSEVEGNAYVIVRRRCRIMPR